jgi:hypothetical protein
MLLGWQMMNCVERYETVDGTMREGQVSHVADDEQAVVTDAPPRLNQCCVGDIET